MTRPDPEAIIAPLKTFQRRTVEHAFQRLFTAPDSTHRFLVADEVGLGKTLVARGIVARALDHLWDRQERIDVLYICSNQNIGRSNLPKLQVTGEAEDAQARPTRLTMLATELAGGAQGGGLAARKVNFISFTPGTSFNMGDAAGKAEERKVLFQLLDRLVARREGLMNLLQGWIQDAGRWRGMLAEPLPLEPEITRRFQERLREDPALLGELEAAIERWFLQALDAYPQEARQARNRLIGRLRYRLAEVCIEALEPGLVILDEFQRFKDLVNQDEAGRSQATALAWRLLQTRQASGRPVRTLLLSATPYKFYTRDPEAEGEDHYADFLATTRFLLDYDERRVVALREALGRFSTELRRAAAGQGHDVPSARAAVEGHLKAIMARTERVAGSADADAMIASSGGGQLEIQPVDVRQYLAAEAWFRSAGARDPMTYWKAAPYLPHFMQGYQVNEQVRTAQDQDPEALREVLARYADAFLDREDLRSWEQLDPGHAKLREVVREQLDTGLWRLLWMPPSLPYWPLDGPFAGQEERTKTLLFSAWHFVPDVVSAVLSYEAERRMLTGQSTAYEDQPKELLQLPAKEEIRRRHRLLLLLLPSTRLADAVHPLSALAGRDARAWARERVAELLAEVADVGDPEAPEDPRWQYMAPLLLDSGLRAFLEHWRSARADDVARPKAESFPDYLEDLLTLDTASLGRQPEGLVDLVTDLALGAPGVVAARTLGSAGLDDVTRRALAARIAMAFWRLFNRPPVIGLLHQLYGRGGGEEGGAYWRRVMQYAVAGNLQAVLDEAWHLAWEQHGWAEGASAEAVARSCAEELAAHIEPRPSRVHVQFPECDGRGGVAWSELRIRTVFAQRFGDQRTEEGRLSQDEVRAAFNSPFRPFVLTSTSIGQEGLDFHPWCHRLVHWNLPSNPVDLEQREGRIHRYKGHAVRRNVAARFREQALEGWAPGRDLWMLLFAVADQRAREDAADDLVPYWIAPGPYRIQRRVPTLPYTREVAAFERLKHQLATYRLAFGQPRQEELLVLLGQAEISREELERWTVRLRPS
ncbi:helicase-related protein [Halorhodospira sp. 9622]|uniref:helicase-related protein n=1 Tax=Halorhodospira sp. 9622 TaxID=2899136 RepID=UPI001EE7E1C8|nr:helicase-related protein [Halorhodospira sp. 9622]MCG5539301.1 DEAD/DEAH box helicase [Halorhodospira sp. 9622]